MPRQKASGPLKPEQLGALAEASLDNAARLLGEARALLRGRATARAYSLALLAAEEFGKCQLALGSIGRGEAESNYWKEWWRTFYGHGPKLARAALIANQLIPGALLQAFIGLLEPALEKQRREVGFYVDVIDGHPISPSTAIDSDEAQAAIDCFGAVIDLYVQLYEGKGLAEAYQQAQADAVIMRAALESGAREDIRDAWEATTGRRLNDDEMDRLMAQLQSEE